MHPGYEVCVSSIACRVSSIACRVTTWSVCICISLVTTSQNLVPISCSNFSVLLCSAEI